ncbi:GNAT family N-acetyltransferase [Rhodococcus hoagii]|uniref:MarR family transcriptional regulator n=1 Tax=Rhodococcus hoagii (strain 103S) TaxID=685727 RepID=A0A3S5Y1M9_RHOH1|nr:helix-turn-helix domain-containing GNAT family N-acetyltransferase [Prescottella equi]MDP8017081.1 helix-turn-helix domain-containing GNAT family N-acetyltransferase [Prescottella equi]NKR89107.1 GNAT family N-acetyltransferase [Prescottella equi]NKS04991.1 GNAT family N-acetyltransferase [Prescottella equi]NKS95519.1 GNAT family N-acetyltransferase [Prescottella equi]NKT11355.1 GNAT family N-acetyltransferase [Prescottella equi]
MRDLPKDSAALRSFNMNITEQLGVLHDRYLDLPRPYSQARILWEVGHDTVRVRDLRARFDLDSGYASRLLSALADDGVLRIEPDPHDGRGRVVTLTAGGRREYDALEKASQDRAERIIGALPDRQRAELLAAMGTVTRLLDAAAVEIAVADPDSEAVRFCFGRYFDELDERLDLGFDPAASTPADGDELRAPNGAVLIADLRGAPIGCGAVKLHDGVAEIKRMWVSPDARGLGLSRRLLGNLEARAADHGARLVRLDTNAALTQAIMLYERSGYRRIPPYNDNAYATHWFEKDLLPAPAPE